MKKLMMSVMILGSMSASAIDITITETACSNSGVYTNANCAQLTNEVKNLVDEDLPDVSIGDYGTGIANANGFAYKGLGSDYSDTFTFFSVRGALGAAVDGDIDKPEAANGIGIGAAVTVGLNLDILPVDKIGPVDLDKMDLFVSFMSYNMDQDQDDLEIKGDISSFAVMARYRIVDGIDFVPGYMLQWGGVYLHTGLQRSSWDASVKSIFDDQQVDINGANATFKNANAKFDIDTTTTTIPVEISTYLRAAYVFTLFGGAGFDLVSGSTDVSLKASGTVEAGSASDYAASISASESDSGDADLTNFRAFFGVQFNIPFVRVYAQMNKGIGNDLIGANAGVKFVF